MANQSPAFFDLPLHEFRDEDEIHGPERHALLLLVLPGWWKGSLELLVVIA